MPDGANGAVFHPVSSVQYPVSAITFAATNETAKRVSPVPLLPNPISHVRRFGRGQRQAEDRQSPREFRPARQTPSLPFHWRRSEEHTSELQSQFHLVCRLLLEKKNYIKQQQLFLLLVLRYR